MQVSDHVVPSIPNPPTLTPILYKDNLIGDDTHCIADGANILDGENINMHEGNVVYTLVNGMISISFSDRVHELVEKSFDHTIIVKLIGRRISYTTLRNKIYDLCPHRRPLDYFQPLSECGTMVTQFLHSTTASF
ncbi:hypothetical protein V6N12_034599 [Hibiscus sabdariffa]|uniref:Uncharacterized protein n=1 Tax=Hibiscus sabdariffa TaxID=183260 RepID=A0ABR2DHM7_9ROSI